LKKEQIQMAMNPIPGGFFPASPQFVPQFQPSQPMNSQPANYPAPMPNFPMDFNQSQKQFGAPGGFNQPQFQPPQSMPLPNQFAPQQLGLQQLPPQPQQAGPYPFGPGQTNPLLNPAGFPQNAFQPALGNPVPPNAYSNAYMSNSGQAGPAAGFMPAPQGPYGNLGWVG
jgi:hypothetical protein